MSDGDLVRRARTGRTAAYAELARRWSPRVAGLCHAKTGSADAVEDLTQEVLLRGYQGLATLADPEKFGPWLRGIAQNVCHDWLKAKARAAANLGSHSADVDPLAAAPCRQQSPDELVAEREELGQLVRAVETLPALYREALMIYYYDDVTYRQMADMLDVSPATINARLTKARAMLRQRLTSSRS